MANLTNNFGEMLSNLLLLMCAGGGSKRHFAPRFTNPAHGGTSDRSRNGYIADVSALVTWSVACCTRNELRLLQLWWDVQ